MSATERLARLVCELTNENLNNGAVERSRVHYLDWIACCLAGGRTDPGRKILSYAERFPEPGPCTAFGLETTRSARQAAFVNGALSKASQLDDMDRSSIVHPAVAVMPAALAVAEEINASSADLQRAIVAGYEVANRVGRAAGTAHYDHWHSTGTCGLFGAAAAASALLRLPIIQTQNALGLAATQAAGLLQCVVEGYPEGLFLHSGKAASDGVLSARLAEAGLNGALFALEGRAGFLAATTAHPNLSVILDSPDLPDQFAIESVSLKRWASCMYTHTAVLSAVEIASELPSDAVIESVEIETTKHGCSIVNRPDPPDVRAARYSIQFGVAAAFWRRGFDSSVFSEAVLNDAAVRAFMDRVVVREADDLEEHFPLRWPARVKVTTASGTTIERTTMDLPGSPENPLTFDDVKDKFNECAPGDLRREVADLIIAGAETLGDPGTLVKGLKFDV